MRLVADNTQQGERIDLGPGWATAHYEDGYVFVHQTVTAGGRGGGSSWLKLRPGEALLVAAAIRREAEKHDEGVA